MKKNTATKWIVFAFDRTDNTPKTGDAAQITANVYIDGGAANAVDDTNPAELGGGYYIFDITAAECNGDLVVISPGSSTADIQVIGVPGAAWTDTLAADIAVVDGIVDDVLVDTGTTLPGSMALDATVAKEASLAALATAADLAVVDGIVDNILADTGATLDAKIDAIDVVVDAIKVVTDALVAPPTPAAIADAVWDEAIAGHAGAGSTGEKLTAAATAGDPWSTALPGAYGAGTAGKLISDTKIEVDAILVDTGTTLDTKLDALLSDVIAISPAGIADAVWDEAIAGHVAAGSTGEKLGDAGAAATPPTVGEISDAVWDELSAQHVAAGSVGEAVVTLLAAAPPTPSAIAAEVLGTVVTGALDVSDVLSALYAGQVAGGSGAGAIPFTVTINVDGQPEDGVEVWITTDVGGTNIIAGTLVTDAFGHAVFMLDAGTYFLWKQKSGVDFTNPETIVVS